MINIAHAKQLVRQLLLGTSTVAAIAGDHVYGNHPQDPDASNIPMPCVIMDVQGGGSNYCGGIQNLGMDLYAYSRTSQDDADALYQAVYAALHAARLVSTVTGTGGAKVNPQAGGAREVARPVNGWNEAISAWYALGKWSIITAG